MEINKTRSQLLSMLGLGADIKGAAGNYLELKSGRRVFDAIAQYGAIPFGHAPAFVIDSLARHFASAAPSFVQPYENGVARDLADALTELTEGKFHHATFASTGAEAVEAALKIVRGGAARPGRRAAAGGGRGGTRGARS